MEEQIKKLIELAKEYVMFGIEVELLDDHHNCLRGNGATKADFCTEGDLINVYFADERETWSITFKDVTVTGYLNQIKLPIDADANYLQSVYDSARKYLYDYLLIDIAKCKISILKDRQEEIKRLEEQIQKLKKKI